RWLISTEFNPTKSFKLDNKCIYLIGLSIRSRLCNAICSQGRILKRFFESVENDLL
ncbi:AAEL005236-PA, partial [Aedes aegypti]